MKWYDAVETAPKVGEHYSNGHHTTNSDFLLVFLNKMVGDETKRKERMIRRGQSVEMFRGPAPFSPGVAYLLLSAISRAEVLARKVNP